MTALAHRCAQPVIRAAGQFKRLLSVRHLAVLSVTLSVIPIASYGDVLDDWNEAVLAAIRIENTPPPLAARNLAIVHLAIFDAASYGLTTNAPYSSRQSDDEGVAIVIAAAARQSAQALFPSQQSAFNRLWAGVEKIATSPSARNCISRGVDAANAVLNLRASDNAQTAITYFPSNQPGAWRRTAPFYRPPELPNWCLVKPFCIPRCDQFRPPPPPSLASTRYAADFNEVKRQGSRNSSSRTEYETESARFWSDFTGSVTPPGHWNKIGRNLATAEKLSLHEKALLLAVLNVALADAGIVCWDAKYRYNSWRPITAIQRADEDGNPDTVADAQWQPLLVTPPFPEYISGHSTFSGAAGEVLREFFGRDNIRFSVGSDSGPAMRTYDSISAVVAEIGRSRILAGIHFPSADLEGQAAGRLVGQYVCDHLLGKNHRNHAGLEPFETDIFPEGTWAAKGGADVRLPFLLGRDRQNPFFLLAGESKR